MDSTVRSIAKAISWRITGSASTFIISYVVVGDVKIASAIAIVQLTMNTILYFLHERLWNRVTWGRD
jgi:uncharacterized membrane protein